MAQNRETRQKIATTRGQITDLDSLKMELEIMREVEAEQNKVILETDDPTTTYRYLLRMQGWMNRTMKYDFALSGANKADAGWHEYVISGRCHYNDLSHFVKNIEYQRCIITLEELAITAEQAAVSDTVTYSMVLRTHFKEGGVQIFDVRPMQNIPSFSYSPLFRSWIVANVPDDDDELPSYLLKVRAATLIGLTQNKAFLRDEMGIIKIISIKGRVAHGYLDYIDLANNRAIFKLHLGGITEEYIMDVNK